MILCDSCSPRNQCTADKSRTECKFYQPFTNEEWFCILPTQEKAKVLGQIAKNAYQCGQNGKTNKCVNRHNCTGYCDYGWEMWLKQPHREVGK